MVSYKLIIMPKLDKNANEYVKNGVLTSSNCFTLRISLGNATLLLVSCKGKSSANET